MLYSLKSFDKNQVNTSSWEYEDKYWKATKAYNDLSIGKQRRSQESWHNCLHVWFKIFFIWHCHQFSNEELILFFIRMRYFWNKNCNYRPGKKTLWHVSTSLKENIFISELSKIYCSKFLFLYRYNWKSEIILEFHRDHGSKQLSLVKFTRIKCPNFHMFS